MNTFLPFLKSTYHFDEIQANTYQKGNRRWLDMKYHHSLRVLETGRELMRQEPFFAGLSPVMRQALESAFLLHDIGRAFEFDENGIKIPQFIHGAEGMHYLKTSLHLSFDHLPDVMILSAILLHDQMDDLLLRENPRQHAKFHLISDNVQQTVLALYQAFEQFDPVEKELIFTCCHLVKDADVLTNLMVFETLFSYSNVVTTPVVSPNVLTAIQNKKYVNYQDVKTLPDNGLVYFGWMYHFYFDVTRKIAFSHQLPELIKTHILNQLQQNLLVDSGAINQVKSCYDRAIDNLYSLSQH